MAEAGAAVLLLRRPIDRVYRLGTHYPTRGRHGSPLVVRSSTEEITLPKDRARQVEWDAPRIKALPPTCRDSGHETTPICLRTPMIIVAAIAVAMGYGLRADRLLRRAREYRFYMLVCDSACPPRFPDDPRGVLLIEQTGEGARRFPPPPDWGHRNEKRIGRISAWKAAIRELHAYHGRRAREMERSAICPWLPVSNDPPPELSPCTGL